MKHMWIRTLALMLALMLSAGNALAAGSLLDGFFDEKDAETPEAESAAAEAEDPGLPFHTFESAYFFEDDYGFSEDRAWVELRDEKRACLINPKGEILFETPRIVSIDAVDDWVNFDRFEPVRNGVTYFATTSGETGASVIIDANGNELARFTGDSSAIRYIAGRTDDRFLLVCIENNAKGVTAYFVPIGLDGRPVDVPRIVSRDEYLTYYDLECVRDFGKGIFCWTGFGCDHNGSILYNLNNNTLQITSEEIRRLYWYDNIALLNGYDTSSREVAVLSLDDFQEDHVNLTSTENSENWMRGKIGLSSENGLNFAVYDCDSAGISPEDAFPQIKVSDDGYAVFSNATGEYYSMLGPDGHYLYEGKQMNGYVEAMGRGGYMILHAWDDHRQYLVDRDGVPHLLSDDLSGLPDLSELRFLGFGCGYLLEVEGHLGFTGTLTEECEASIRSLDGTTLVRGIKRTPDTKALSEKFPAEPAPDFSAAIPVGQTGGEKAQTATAPEEITAMGETGVIYTDDLFGSEGILLLDTEGITLTYYGDSIEIVNNNPDNKRARLSVNDILLDGMDYGTRDDILVKGGETGTRDFPHISERYFMEWMARQLATLAELPLVEITIHFELAIGKDGEAIPYTRTVRRSDYSEEILSPLYGDLIGEYEYEGKPVYSAYRVQQDQKTAVFAIRNISGVDALGADSSALYVRGGWLVNGEQYGNDFYGLSLPKDGVTLMAIWDLDAVYKEVEVANGTPLDLSLELAVPGLEKESAIILDLGQICN